MEGGTQYREGVVEYDGLADSRGAARYFYYSLNEGFENCAKSSPDTASATPVAYDGVWIVGDCENNLLGFKSPDGSAAAGGKLTPLWKTPVTLSSHSFVEPRFATPVIDAIGVQGAGSTVISPGTMYVLWKDEVNPLLISFTLHGASVPTRNWVFPLKSIFVINQNGMAANFSTFAEDHAIFWHLGFLYVPSKDFDGMVIFDPSNLDPNGLPTYAVTPGQWSDSHRLCGSVAGSGTYTARAVFLVHGSLYGIQSYNSTGDVTVGDSQFNAYSNEFSHPVHVQFYNSAYGSIECIIATQWDPFGDLFISAVDARTMETCGTAAGTPWDCAWEHYARLGPPSSLQKKTAPGSF